MTYTSYIGKTSVNITLESGKTMVIFHDTPRFQLAIDAIKRKATAEELQNIFDGKLFVQKWAEGNFKIEGNKVTWVVNPSYEIPTEIAQKLLEYAANGYPAGAFTKFLDRLLRNPSHNSVGTYLSFIDRHGVTISEDGFVILHKGVSDTLRDMHTGKYDNSPGQFLSMPRNAVNDNPEIGCGVGFHGGNRGYAEGFGPRIVLIKVDPADIVSVPRDCDCAKVRFCQYLVLKEVPRETILPLFYDATPETAEDTEVEVLFPNGKIECPDCGTYCDSEDLYCRGCGSELPDAEEDEDLDDEQVICLQCGTDLHDDEAAFCYVCGAKL